MKSKEIITLNLLQSQNFFEQKIHGNQLIQIHF